MHETRAFMHDGQSRNWISRDFQLSHDFLNHVMILTWLLLTATAEKYTHMSSTWMSRVTRMDESFHIYEWVMSHVWMSHVMILTWLLLTATAREYKHMSNGRYGEPVCCSALCVLRCIVEHIHGACHGNTNICRMSHVTYVSRDMTRMSHVTYRMSHVTYVKHMSNESCHICRMSHVTYVSRVWRDPCHTNEWAMSHMSHIISNMYEWVMSHIWMSHVTHMSNGPCLACSITLIFVTDTYGEPVCCSALCVLRCIVLVTYADESHVDGVESLALIFVPDTGGEPVCCSA